MTISEKIEYLLEHRNQYRADLVRGTDIPDPTIRNWKRLEIDPPIGKMVKVADYFHLPLEAFVRDDNFFFKAIETDPQTQEEQRRKDQEELETKCRQLQEENEKLKRALLLIDDIANEFRAK